MMMLGLILLLAFIGLGILYAYHSREDKDDDWS